MYRMAIVGEWCEAPAGIHFTVLDDAVLISEDQLWLVKHKRT